MSPTRITASQKNALDSAKANSVTTQSAVAQVSTSRVNTSKASTSKVSTSRVNTSRINTSRINVTQGSTTAAIDDCTVNRPQPSWPSELAAANISINDLLAQLNIPIEEAGKVMTQAQLDTGFPLFAPPAFLKKIKPGDIHDPLLMQVLPLTQELEAHSGFVEDPLQESGHNPIPGVIHKYRSRALLTVSGKCAINCRYCFRREFPYHENNPGKRGWLDALQYIRAHPEINEIILSGGDPLSANDRTLSWLINELAEIDTLKRLRIHTRLPVVMPNRICEELLEWLDAWPRQKIVVIHCNHAQELDEDVGRALNRLKKIGATLLNQSVLLKGVNDNADTLAKLSENLFAIGVMPYYLHLLDKVKGAHHFLVPEQEATTIYSQLAAQLPGFLLPKLVIEISGQTSKSIVAPPLQPISI